MKALILSSGFLSFSDVKLTSISLPEKFFDRYILFKDTPNANNPFYYSSGVVSVYERVRNDPFELNKFETREEIISLAKNLFKSRGLVDWLRFQHESPLAFKAHADFIEDTVKYLTGESRRIFVAQWLPLIRPKNLDGGNSSVSRDRLEKLADFVRSHPSFPMDVNSLIQTWLSKHDGFMDLLTTLYIIFGSKPFQQNATDGRSEVSVNTKDDTRENR